MERMNSGRVDRFRMLAAFLVVAIHTYPLASVSPTADFLLSRVLARVAVPFFLMATGYFALSGCLDRTACFSGTLRPFLKKTGLLYGVSILVYLPVNLYAGQLKGLDAADAVRLLLFDGTFYHLWYLPAAMLGALIVYALGRRLRPGWVLGVTFALYLVGLGGDSWYGLVQTSGAKALYAGVGLVSTYTRNGVFYAPLFLALGACLAGRRPRLPRWAGIAVLAASLAAMIAEALLLQTAGSPRHDSMYLCLPLTMAALFPLLLGGRARPSPLLRRAAMLVYLLHPLCIIGVRGAAKLLGLTKWLVDCSPVHYLAVCAASLAASLCIALLLRRLRRPRSRKGRAWAEVDLGAIGHNLEALCAIAPETCRMMPVLKAEAYGHGAVPVAQYLARLGIRDFCVATLDEAVQLRRAGVLGQILVLGYVRPRDFPLAHRYHITITLVDAAHARAAAQYGRRLHAHLKLDTGMHRLGIPWDDMAAAAEVFTYHNLRIDGVFTHLCAADGRTERERDYTAQQLRRFETAVAELERRGISRTETHVQSSYGLLNYPELRCDLARPGVALYGVLSGAGDETAASPALRPALTLKARVAHVADLAAGQSMGYGMDYVAERDRRVAVLSIGYADGLPRALSGGRGAALLHGQRAPILGRVCMDQMTVDVTDIPGVEAGDEAVLLGSGLPAEAVADAAGTITNELLSRLGARLPRVYTEGAR